MTGDEEHLGATIRRLRKAAGLSQQRLSAKAQVSLSLVEKVERGDRAASHALIATVARALRVPVEQITGQPYTDHRDDDGLQRAVDDLRTVLRHYDLPEDVPPRPAAELAADVDTVAAYRRTADYKRLAPALPGLLQELTTAAHTDADPAAVHRLLITVYHAAHTLLHRCGYADLAESVDHMLERTAHLADDPVALGLSRWTRAQAFQSTGDYRPGLRLMDTARAELAAAAPPLDPAAVTMLGSLHLRSVTLASRDGDTETTRHHLAEARRLTRGPDSVHYGLTFGPANTTIHEVAAHVELGDSSAALGAADHWTPPKGLPRTRRGHHYIDLARAYLLHGDRQGALGALQTARRLAPQQTRKHPMVRDTIAVLVDQHRRSNPELTHFAAWVGLKLG